MKKIKVAIVDDSAFMRKVIRDSLTDRGFEVVNIGRNGKDAVEIASNGTVNVMTLDVQMPLMDGLEALKKIMSTAPMPVIMLSSLTKKDARITVEALSLGAFDFVTKPGGAISLDFNVVADELAEKIVLAASYKPASKPNPPQMIKYVSHRKKYDFIVIGSSTGGPRALDVVIQGIPSNFPLPVLIVQHMPPKFTTALAMRLNDESKLKVVEVTKEMELFPKMIYVATGDKHMEVFRKNGILAVRPMNGPKMNSVKPAVDYTLISAAESNASVLCAILTGMGKDGTEGVKRFKKNNITVVAESQKTAIVYGMPKSIVNAGLADYVLDLNEISGKIVELI